MRVFVGVIFGRDGDSSVICVEDSRPECLQRISQFRRELLHWSPDAVDGPEGGALIQDARGDIVGKVHAFDVAGEATLQWTIDAEGGFLSAPSILHDDGSTLRYTVFGDGEEWKADFDGRDFASGTLEHCMAACRKSEDEAVLQAVQNQQEHDDSWPKDCDKHDRCEWILRRMLDPEDLGMAVPAHVRDDVREVLGMARCESK